MVFPVDGGMLYIWYVFGGYVYYGIEHHYANCADGIRYDYAVPYKKRERKKFCKIGYNSIGYLFGALKRYPFLNYMEI